MGGIQVQPTSDEVDSNFSANTITAMVDYQEGAIVSRTLLKKDNGSVTLFAFDEGEELSEHSTPHEALLIVLDGVAEISIIDKVHQLESGDVITLPANKPHAVKANQSFKMMLIMLGG